MDAAGTVPRMTVVLTPIDNPSRPEGTPLPLADRHAARQAAPHRAVRSETPPTSATRQEAPQGRWPRSAVAAVLLLLAAVLVLELVVLLAGV